MAYPDNMFSSVVKNCDKNGELFNYIQRIKDKFVCVTGMIKDYNGKANIEITSKEQMRIKE